MFGQVKKIGDGGIYALSRLRGQLAPCRAVSRVSQR